MKKLYSALLLTAALTACHSEHAPVTGQVAGSTEVFTGTVKDFSSSKGKLLLNSNYGVNCEGHFDNKGPTIASGTLKCTDGRVGQFTLNTDGTKGSGYGTLNDKAFTFTFKD